MSVKHENVYENLAEAQMRLLKTMVVYDKEPYQVIAITAHKGAVFRVYLEPITLSSPYNNKSPTYALHRNVIAAHNSQSTTLGAAIDEWMESNKDVILRKKMNSPLFNKFRPFPLGMVNTGESGNGVCYFVERQPMRHREQGLTAAMLTETRVTCGREETRPGLSSLGIYTEYFRDTIMGKYPSAKECIAALTDSDVTNEALAFDRLFAIVRGPLDTLYLAYKDEIVARLPNDDLSVARLGSRFRHLREVVSELGVFRDVA